MGRGIRGEIWRGSETRKMPGEKERKRNYTGRVTRRELRKEVRKERNYKNKIGRFAYIFFFIKKNALGMMK